MNNPETTPLSFDRSAAADFLTFVFGVRHGHAVIAFGLDGHFDATGKYTHRNWSEHGYRWPQERDRLLTDVAREAASGNVDVYVCPALRETPHRRKGNAAHHDLLFVDRDGHVPLDVAALAELGSLLVVDSGTAGHEHAYVKLADDPGPERREALCRALADRLGSCDAKYSDNDLLRLPGTANHKHGNTVAVRHRRHGALDATVVEKLLDVSAIATGADLPPEVLQALSRDTGDRSVDMHAIVGACHRAGLSLSETIRAARGHPGSVEKYGPRLAAEVQRSWLSVVDEAQAAQGAKEQPARLALTQGDGVAIRNPRWLETHRLPAEAQSVMVGPEGGGKTTFALGVAARVTTGTLDGALRGVARNVIIVSVEDAREEVLAPRLRAAGADMTRVYFLSVLGDPFGLPTLPDDVAELDRLAAEVDAALIVIDPISAMLSGKVDSHNDASTRRALAPLAALAQRRHCAVLTLMHLNKMSSEPDLLNRVNGSRAFTASARAIIGIVQDPGAEDGSRLAFVRKSNMGPVATVPALRFVVEEVAVDGAPGTLPVLATRARIVGEVMVDATTLLAPDEGKSDAIGDWLVSYLGDGRKSSSEVEHAARAHGYVWRTVQRRAQHLKIEYTEEGFPARTYWSLPGKPDDSASDASRASDATSEAWRDRGATDDATSDATVAPSQNRDATGATGATGNLPPLILDADSAELNLRCAACSAQTGLRFWPDPTDQLRCDQHRP